MKRPDINRLIDLQKFILELQAVDRALYIPDKVDRHENDVEHSYSLAMAAWFLVQYFPELNRDEVIRLALVHDLVEVHAGDTFPFHNEEHVATKKEREEAALEKIDQEWPDFEEMVKEMRHYEQHENAEAKFVYALDKVMPAIVNLLQGGRAWQENNISLKDITELKTSKVALSPEIEIYYRELLVILRGHPKLFAARD